MKDYPDRLSLFHLVFCRDKCFRFISNVLIDFKTGTTPGPLFGVGFI